MASAVQPFIPDHAVRFAQQLFDFLTSKLSIAGYDRLVFGEAARPTEAVVQTTPGPQASHDLEPHASSSSPVSSHGSPGVYSDTDSDAYMSLLHQQPSQTRLDESSRSGPRKDGAANPGNDSMAATSSVTNVAAAPFSTNATIRRRSTRQEEGVLHKVQHRHKRKHKRKKHKHKHKT